MDTLADSDCENTLPPLPVSAVDTELLRDFYAFCSDHTRARLRAQAADSPVAALYAVFDAGLPDDFAQEAGEDPVLELSRPAQLAPSTDQQIEAQISESEPALNGRPQSPTNIAQDQAIEASFHEAAALLSPPESAVDSHTPTDAGFQNATRRSLRKRNFASRHPYIADQADWLGICTVDSMNEMFDADAPLGSVVSVLNRLYLQKKKRYGDEERYKAKDFYAHLGRSKLLALQGDSDLRPADIASEISNQPDGGEDGSQRSEFQASQDYASQQYGSSQTNPSQLGAMAQNSVLDDELVYDVEPLSSDQSSSEAELDEEQLIRVGTKYRKLSTILRGVLPESAKRLPGFHEKAKLKPRKKKVARQIVPRKGLAMKKFGRHSAQSDELQQELLLSAQQDQEPQPQHQPVISNYTTLSAELYNSSAIQRPSSRGSMLDTPEPITLDSASDSDDELVHLPSYSLPHFTPADNSDEYPEVIEDDHIDRLLAGEKTHPRKRLYTKRSTPSNHTPSYRKPSPLGIPRNSRPYISRKSGGRKQQSRVAPHPTVGLRFKNTRGSAATKLHAFSEKRGPPRQSRLPIELKPAFQKAPPSTKKPDSKHKETTQSVHVSSEAANPYQRKPITGTAIVEIESVSKFVKPLQRKTFNYSLPSRDLVTGSAAFNLLIGTDCMTVETKLTSGGAIFEEDTVFINILGRSFSLGLFHLADSLKSVVTAFIYLRKLMANPETVLDPVRHSSLVKAIGNLTKWMLICREKPSSAMWTQLEHLFNHLSKLQRKVVRERQLVYHAQFLYLFFVLMILEKIHTNSSETTRLRAFLDRYCVDFWLIFFLTFNASELSHCFGLSSPRHEIHESLILVFSIFRDERSGWWHLMAEALHDSLSFQGTLMGLMETTYVLSATVPRSNGSWAPFLAIFDRPDTNNSESHHYFMDICEMLTTRLGWPMEDRIVTQIYLSFARRKFANFAEETAVPVALGTVHSLADLPTKSAFEHFMCMLYTHISSLSLAKEVKKLISKLLASSQYVYARGRQNQIMFANRVNMIVLLAQVSNIDFGNHFVNLIEQIKGSKDSFVYGRSLEALEVLCEVDRRHNRPVQGKAFMLLFNSELLASMHGSLSIFNKLIDLLSVVFQGPEKAVELFVLLQDFDLDILPDSLKLSFLGIITLTAQDLPSGPVLEISGFQKSLTKFISSQMNRLPVFDKETDEMVEETVEMSLLIWHLISRATGTHHWNIMMHQKFSYFGNAILRNRFILFFCIGYLYYNNVDDSDVIGESDRLFIYSLVSPTISKYTLPLYHMLSQDHRSVTSTGATQDINTAGAMQAFKLQLVTKGLLSVTTSKSMSKGEKQVFITGFVSRVHEELTNNPKNSMAFCRKVSEFLQEFARPYVESLDQFWDIVTRVGLPNKRVQDGWTKLNDRGKVQMLNLEFLAALNHGKQSTTTMEYWTKANSLALFSLIEVYIATLGHNKSYWPHVSHLLHYTLTQIHDYKVPTEDSSFLRFLELLELVANAALPQNYRDSIYQLRALSTACALLLHALMLYLGYIDRQDVVHVVHKFISGIDAWTNPDLRTTSSFTDLTVESLRTEQELAPRFDEAHTREQYLAKYAEVIDDLQMLQLTVESGSSLEIVDFDFSL